MALLARVLLLSTAVVLSVGLPPAGAAAGAQPILSEAQAKAGFLYNCAMFVSWPSAAGGKAELVIGVVGDEAVAAVVKDMHGQTVNGRTIRVVPVRSDDGLERYHILFIAGDDSRSSKAVLARIGDASVLTVGESDDFTSRGGVVRLYTDQGRLRFEINMTRAEDAGLRVSAKMLGLAKIVR